MMQRQWETALMESTACAALHNFGIKSHRVLIEYPLKKLILIHVYSYTPCRNDTMRPSPDEARFASSFAAVCVSCRRLVSVAS